MKLRSILLPVALAGLSSVSVVCGDAGARPRDSGYCHDYHGRNLCDGQEQRERMREQWLRSDLLLPPIVPEELPEPESQGARIMVKYCVQCHNLAAPAMHSAQDWPGIVERMKLRLEWMGKRESPGGLKIPTGREYRILRSYLKKYAQKAIVPEKMPDAESRTARDFRRFCSRCHALPDPAQHTIREWKGVVGRMEHYMRRSGQVVPDREQKGRVLRYLTKYAAPPPSQPTGP